MGDRSNFGADFDIRTSAETSGLDKAKSALDAFGLALDALGIDTTQLKNKTDDLETAFKNLDDETDKAEKGVKDFSNETTSSKTDVDNFETALQGAGNEAENLDDSLDDAEGGMESLTSAVNVTALALNSMAIIDTISGSITELVNTVAEFDEGSRKLQAQSGLTGEAFDELNDIATSLYNQNFGDSFGELGDSLNTIRSITGLTGDDLEDLSADILTYADVFDKDVLEVTRAADQMMQQFGVSGSEAMDLIAFTTQNAGDTQDDLLDTITEYSSTFADMGLDAEQVINSLMNANDAGVFSFDKSADAMREFNIRFREGSEVTEEAYNTLINSSDDFVLNFEDGTSRAITSFDQLQQEVADGNITVAEAGDMMRLGLQGIEDESERARLGAALIGTQYEDLGDDILGAFTVGGIGEYNGKLDEMQEVVGGGLSASWASFTRTLTTTLVTAVTPLAVAIMSFLLPAMEGFSEWLVSDGLPAIQSFVSEGMEVLGPILQTAAQFVGELVGEFTEFLNQNPQVVRWVSRAAAVVVGLIAALSGAGAVVGGVVAAFALLTNPFVLLVAAIIAFQAAYESNLYGFADVVDSVVAFVLDTLDSLLAWFISDGLPFIANAVNDFLAGWEIFKTAMSALWEAVKPTLDSIYNWFITDGLPFIKSAIDDYILAWETMGNIMANIWEVVKPGLEDLLAWFISDGLPFIQTAIDDYIDGLQETRDILLALWALVKPHLESMYNWFVTDGLPFILAAVNDLYLKFIVLKNFVVTIWTLIKPEMEKLYNWFVTDGLPFVLSAVNDVYLKFIALKNFVVTLWTLIKPEMEKLYNWFVIEGLPWVTSAIAGAEGALNLLQTKAVNLWANVGAALNTAKDNIIGIFNLIKDAVQPVIDAIAGIKTAIDNLPSLPNLNPLDLVGGSATGGFTGTGGITEPAGTVHKNEYVVPAQGARVLPSPSGLVLQGSGAAGGGGGGQSTRVQHVTNIHLNRRQIAQAMNEFDSDRPRNPSIIKGSRR